MKTKSRLTALIAASALTLAPAAALAQGVEYTPAHPTHPKHPTTPGPKAPLPAKAKAYGVHCRSFSKEKQVKGEKGTPFSQCVTAMAKAAKAPEQPAKVACRVFLKHHKKGKKGTEFSRCVVAAAQVKKEVTAG